MKRIRGKQGRMQGGKHGRGNAEVQVIEDKLSGARLDCSTSFVKALCGESFVVVLSFPSCGVTVKCSVCIVIP